MPKTIIAMNANAPNTLPTMAAISEPLFSPLPSPCEFCGNDRDVSDSDSGVPLDGALCNNDVDVATLESSVLLDGELCEKKVDVAAVGFKVVLVEPAESFTLAFLANCPR